jgi:hypothetical protein
MEYVKKNQAGGGTTAPRFSLRRRNILPAWKTSEPRFHWRGDFFLNQPHNSLQRGIEPGWLRPYLSSTSQLGLGFGMEYVRFVMTEQQLH